MLVLLAKSFLCFTHGSCRGLCAYLLVPFLIASKVATKVATIFTLIYDMYIKLLSGSIHLHCTSLYFIQWLCLFLRKWLRRCFCMSICEHIKFELVSLNLSYISYTILKTNDIITHNFRFYSRRNNKELKRTLR